MHVCFLYADKRLERERDKRASAHALFLEAYSWLTYYIFLQMKQWAGVAQSTVGHGLLSGGDFVPFSPGAR